MITPKNFSDLDWLCAGFYNKTECDQVFQPVLMDQTHSADVLVLDSRPETPPKLDALITQKAGLTLTVKTADCAPILFADTQARIIAAVHAGWKGAFQGIIEMTLLKMLSIGGSINNIRAAIGPHLQKNSFQITQDMLNLFPVTERARFMEETETGIYFDFDAYLVHRLKRAGVTNIDSAGIDTYTSNDYNSYRREPKNPARQYSAIMIREK